MPAGFVTVPVTVVCVLAGGVAGFALAAIVTTAGCKVRTSFLSTQRSKCHSTHQLHAIRQSACPVQAILQLSSTVRCSLHASVLSKRLNIVQLCIENKLAP